MKLHGLLLRGLLHHWRLYAGVFLGTALAAVVLTGALLVGVSVDRSLAGSTEARLGGVEAALSSGQRLVQRGLAPRLEAALGEPVASALQVRAVALRRGPEGEVVATTGLTLHGVEPGFGRLGPAGEGALGLPPAPGEILLNERARRELGAAPGEIVTLRVPRMAALPMDAPLSSSRELTRLGSFTVAGVLPPEGLGDLNLRHEQLPPANAFVDQAWLQRALGRPEAVNLLLSTAGDTVDRAFAASFSLADLGYRLAPLPALGVVQLEAERVFLEPAVADAAMAQPGAVGGLTWLVDSLVAQRGATPYSFVVALTPSDAPGSGPVPAGMADDEIVLNAWTAQELGVAPGDEVLLGWSQPAPGGAWVPGARSFRVHSVVAMEALAGEREAVPAFPGLTDADRCGDWDIGLPLDQDALRDPANERYWLDWRQTPKAFVTLAAGQAMWSTRWGAYSAVRFPAESAPTLEALAVPPRALGLAFEPVAAQAQRALDDAIDFGGLFLGLSIFIIAAALALTAMLHAFAVQRRRRELGTLRALGFSPGQVAGLLLGEGALVTLAGALAGSLGGGLYTRAVLVGLRGVWHDAVASTEIAYHGALGAQLGGALAAALCAGLAVAVSLARLRRRALSELLADGADAPVDRPGRSRGAAVLAVTAALASLALALGAGAGDSTAFFLAGALLLLASLAALAWGLERWDRPAGGALGLGSLALRNAARRRWRSLGAAGTFACGCFVVVAVSSMSGGLSESAGARSSGTGGFATYAEAVLPVPVDAVEREGIVPLRVREGDDASCQNLERAQSPRLLGVDPALLEGRRAFDRAGEGPSVWALLQRELPPGVVPGLVGDGDTAAWNLGLRTGPEDGDELRWLDEQGRELRVRLVGALPQRKSILQGTVLIAEQHFTAAFPSEAGYRTFLLDAPPEVSPLSAERFAHLGLDLQDSVARLGRFYAVEHSYLRIFGLLGGLGLLLGSVGMGVVVLRNLGERRREHALLRTLGFPAATVAWLLLLEHAGLFVAGMVVGTASALVAVAPVVAGTGAELALRGTLLLLLATLVVGLLTVGIPGAWVAFRGVSPRG